MCTRRELESLVGLLNHACNMVHVGCSFLRRMFDLLHSRSSAVSHQGTTPIRLNTKFQADLAWWKAFVSPWNGISFLFEQGLASSTCKTYSVASNRFYGFCSKYCIVSPFPVDEYTLCCYPSHLVEEGLLPQTVKIYLSAVRNLQLSFGFLDPRDNSSLPVLKRVLKCGVRKN